MPKTYLLSAGRSPKAVYLLSAAGIAGAEADTPRRFSGIANSGKPFIYEGKAAIVDLSSLRFAEQLPALIDHDRSKRAGFGKLSIAKHQLSINGTLLNNEHGQAIAGDSDAGFPWQMSAHVVPALIEDLPAGQHKTINGQLISGPLRILKNAQVREISFTPTGVDSQTHAVVLSDDGSHPFFPPEQEEIMNLEEALNEISKLKAQLAQLEKDKETLAQEKTALEKAAAEAQEQAQAAEVEAQLSQKGFKKTADGKGWQGISAAMYGVLLSAKKEDLSALLGDLSPQAGAPDYLLSEQHPPQQAEKAEGLLAARAERQCNKTYI